MIVRVVNCARYKYVLTMTLEVKVVFPLFLYACFPLSPISLTLYLRRSISSPLSLDNERPFQRSICEKVIEFLLYRHLSCLWNGSRRLVLRGVLIVVRSRHPNAETRICDFYSLFNRSIFVHPHVLSYRNKPCVDKACVAMLLLELKNESALLFTLSFRFCYSFFYKGFDIHSS